MLSVRYSHEVPPALAEMAEHHARAAGLSLGALEAIGATLEGVEAFIVASEAGDGLGWAQRHGHAPPQETVARARWVATRLFGA